LRQKWQPNSDRRAAFLIAAIAICIALLLLLLPHGQAGAATAFLVILPIVFIGVLLFTGWLSRMQFLRLSLAVDEPALPTSFQRPPPYLLA
jgi:hypothetical protein